MPRKRPDIINIPHDPESFHLLFLSEGFLDSAPERALFHTFCKQTTLHFLAIHPYNTARRNFAVRSLFVPSATQGIAGNTLEDKDTAFKFYRSPGNKLVTNHPGRIIDILLDIDLIPYAEPEALLPVNGEEIWLDGATVGSRAICVIARTPEKLATTLLTVETNALVYPPSVTEELENMLPYVSISMFPVLPPIPTSATYENSYIAVAAILAHELGHVFGLADEYERSGGVYEHHPADKPEPIEPNITSASTVIKTDGTVDIGKIKWLDMCSPSRRSSVQSFQDRIGMSDAEETALFSQIAVASKNAVIHLKHPQDDTNPDDTSDFNKVRYTSGARQVLHVDEPKLIEGGKYYRRDIFRPSVECMMRWEGDDYNLGSSKKLRHVMPYCRICRRHIIGKLNGLNNFQFGAVQIIPTPFHPRNLILRSRLADAIVNFINNTSYTESMFCVEAMIRRFENFFNNELEWGRSFEVPPGSSTLTGWYEEKIDFPLFFGDAMNMWRIWMSDMDGMKERGLGLYAGLPSFDEN